MGINYVSIVGIFVRVYVIRFLRGFVVLKYWFRATSTLGFLFGDGRGGATFFSI